MPEIRRKDRALSQSEAFKILDFANYAVLSCADDNGEIFSIPISIVREDSSIFIHGAKGGSKARLFQNGRSVTLVAVSHSAVPQPSIEFCESIKNDANRLGSELFTTEYRSTIALTNAYKITDNARKTHALRLLCEKYTPHYMAYFEAAISGNTLARTGIYELKITSITAKAKLIKRPKLGEYA